MQKERHDTEIQKSIFVMGMFIDRVGDPCLVASWDIHPLGHRLPWSSIPSQLVMRDTTSM